MRFSIWIICAPALRTRPYADALLHGAYQVLPMPSPTDLGLKMCDAPPAATMTALALNTQKLPSRTLNPTAPATRLGCVGSISRWVTMTRLCTSDADFLAASAMIGL